MNTHKMDQNNIKNAKNSIRYMGKQNINIVVQFYNQPC